MEVQGSSLCSVYGLEVVEKQARYQGKSEYRIGVLEDSSMCGLCGLEEESCCHLFFGCNFARRVWGLCHRWLGVLVASQIEPKSNFDQFRLSCAS